MKRIYRLFIVLCIGTVFLVQTALPVSAAWQKDNAGRWSYATSSGKATGWQKIDDTWYYFNGAGIMQTGWQKIDGVWYYLRAGGSMVTGWQKIDDTWYYFNGSGAMHTGWLLDGGKWYFLSGSGAMATGWVSSNGCWYLMDSAGTMVTGWADVNGIRYYLTPSGVMATGTLIIDGVTCNFDESGAYIGSVTVPKTMEQEVLSRINDVRAKEGLPPLQLSDKLCAASEQRSKERAAIGSLEHTRPDGSQWWTILGEYGVSNLHGTAENLASGMNTAKAAVKAWVESPTHKHAILGNYQYMGVGIAKKGGVTYWTQLFSGSDTAKNS
ncbi:MAG: hypothetical protein IKM31_05420 [Oscillospiraceae bacterium]|nr:hypothetical protein [Oscillospiraceae bacterium]